MAENRLSNSEVKKIAKQLPVGRVKAHSDGGGLFLHVSRSKVEGQENAAPTASWVYRFVSPLTGKVRDIGLGQYPSVSLDLARERRNQHRDLKVRGQDPVEVRKAQRAAKRALLDSAVTFKFCADKYIAERQDDWREDWAREQEDKLSNHVYPKWGKTALVADIDRDKVVDVLEPLWRTKNATAKKLRGLLESILDWADAHKHREGANPARWEGGLKARLGGNLKGKKASKVRHHSSLPHKELPAFMRRLVKDGTLGALAMRFTILTGVRTNEALGAQWDEIDWNEKTWTVPAERMKARTKHVVPLSPAVIDLLREQRAKTKSPFVFPSPLTDKQPLSNMAMLQTLKRMERTDITVHGFRATLSMWAYDTKIKEYPAEVIEACLAHTVREETVRAYRRDVSFFDDRRGLMEAWGEYCVRSAEIIPMHGKRGA